MSDLLALIENLKGNDGFDFAQEAATRLSEFHDASVLLYAMTGTHDLPEAIRVWDKERTAMSEFHAENIRLREENDLVEGIRIACDEIIRVIGVSGSLFTPPPLQRAIEKYGEAVRKLQKFRSRQPIPAEPEGDGLFEHEAGTDDDDASV